MSSAPPFWSKAPFTRLLPPLITGILVQYHFRFPFSLLLSLLLIFTFLLLLHGLMTLHSRFRWAPATGCFLFLILFISGAMVFQHRQGSHREFHPADITADSLVLVVRLEEPLSQKPKSFKAVASIRSGFVNGKWIRAAGKMIIYFRKEEVAKELDYGSLIMIRASIQPIRNSGNPGSFDYKTYAAFQGLTHQVYLTAPQYVVLPQKEKDPLSSLIFTIRKRVTAIIRRYIPSAREGGLAEALLIGYKEDLDKDLVQAYANTGVVHVIAISGLHLGLIYAILLVLTHPLRKNTRSRWLRMIIILSALWLFSLLAGAQPSVLRSAVMFSFIALGVVMSRRTSSLNTLAMSAFLLLCYHPGWLWDAGFQLSYAAVLSIFLFYTPVYRWCYFPNKLLDFLWKGSAVTLAAQLLTIPVTIFHFHQVPILFMFTNLVAVPLSSLILIGEIILCAVSFIPVIAIPTGNILHILIALMNSYIERFNLVSFAVWGGLSISALQSLLLTGFILLGGCWLLEKKPLLLPFSLAFLLAFTGLRSLSFLQCTYQKKLIIYQVPGHAAMDLVWGRRYSFLGDSLLQGEGQLSRFHLQSSRVLHRVKEVNIQAMRMFSFGGKKILRLNGDLPGHMDSLKADLLILSGKPREALKNLQAFSFIGLVVIDSSVPSWKAAQWRKECAILHIPCYDVAQKGAFVMNL